MKKIEVLCWGISHIAENHGFSADTNWEEDGEVCLYGGCNLPTLADVKFMAEDLGIPKDFVEHSEFGIDVFLPLDWYENESEKDYVPTGNEMWTRCGVAIGA